MDGVSVSLTIWLLRDFWFGSQQTDIIWKHLSVCMHMLNKHELTPDENQSPSGVGVTKDRIASTIDTEVDAAEDLPHFSISTPPLCKSKFTFSICRWNPHGWFIEFFFHKQHSAKLTFWTFSVNSSSNHLWSLITSFTGKPLILAFKKSGTWKS